MSPDEIAFDLWCKKHNVTENLDLVRWVWMEATKDERRGCARLCFSTWDAMANACGKSIKKRATEHNRHQYE